jgi:UMF1 family MFS transporter
LPYLLFFTLMAVIPTFFVTHVPVLFGVALFCLANFGYQAALVYYDATIRVVSTPANRGWVSGLGNGLGYLGTILIGVIILVMSGSLPDAPSDAQFYDFIRNVFILAPALFAILAIPMFLVIKEVPEPAGRSTKKNSLLATLDTIKELKKVPGLRRFLIARFFYTDAQNTVISIMTVFATSAVGFSLGMANIVLVALASTAVVGGIYWGRRTDSHGPKSSLNRVLALWSVALVLGSISLLFTGEAIAGFTQGQVIFVIAGVILGFGFGGLSGADRIIMYRLSPPKQLGEFYGLYGLVGKGSQVIGSLIYGATLFFLFEPLQEKAYAVGLLTLLATMLVGWYLLKGVPEQREG